MKKRLTILGLLFVLIACNKDCTHNYTYYFQNDSLDSIKVIFNHINFIDTVEIAKGVKKKLFHTNHGLENCDKGPQFLSVQEDLKAFKVLKNGKETTKDFFDDKNWDYSGGDYEAFATDSDF